MGVTEMLWSPENMTVSFLAWVGLLLQELSLWLEREPMLSVYCLEEVGIGVA